MLLLIGLLALTAMAAVMAVPALAELVEKGEGILTDLDALNAKAADEKDEAKGKAIADEIEAKTEEFDGLKGKIEAAKAMDLRRQMLLEAREAAKTRPAGDLHVLPARAKGDPDADPDLENAFWSYVKGTAISDRAREALQPRGESFKMGAGGVRMPRRMAAKMLGKAWAAQMAETPEEIQAAMGKVLGSVTAGTGPELVPAEDYIAQLLRLPGEPATILQRCTVIPCTTGRLTFPKLEQSDAGGEYGGVVFTWITEGAQKGETEPAFQELNIDTSELAGYTEVTQRLLERSRIPLEALLTSLYRDAMLNQIDTVILTGTGAAQPLGIIPCAGVRVVPRATAAQVNWADLVGLKHALMAYHRGNAIFAIDDTAEEDMIANRLDSQNRPLFNNNFGEGMWERLVGKPYITLEKLPNLGTEGDVVFGDFSKYVVAMEQDVVIKRSDHYQFRNNRVAFVVYAVLGGRPVLPRAFAILSDTS